MSSVDKLLIELQQNVNKDEEIEKIKEDFTFNRTTVECKYAEILKAIEEKIHF